MSLHWSDSEKYLQHLMKDPDRLKLTPVFINKTAELQQLLEVNKDFLSVVSFVAPWLKACEEIMKFTREFVVDPDLKHVLFVELTASDWPDVCSKFRITSIPSVLFFRNRNVIHRLIGSDEVENYLAKVFQLSNGNPTPQELSRDSSLTNTKVNGDTASVMLPFELEPTTSIPDFVKKLVTQADVMIFMKGDPERPRCKFSRQIVQIIHDTDVPYEYYDVLEDEDVRQGLKALSNWQTYPQVYVHGKFIGGLNVISELRDSNQLTDVLKGKAPENHDFIGYNDQDTSTTNSFSDLPDSPTTG